MKKVTKRRLEALVLAVALGVTSVTGYERLTGKRKVYAAEPDTVIFAEGTGTGKDFSDDSWVFDSKKIENNNPDTIGPIEYEAGKPGIVKNQYSGNNEKVIRLIEGVRAKNDANGNATYEEEPIKYEGSEFDYFRSGKAEIRNNDGNGIPLNGNKDFSMKFTFSMPEAVVNTKQTNGEQYAREVGGDGICFAMTTTPNQQLGTGSGIGYQGMSNSFAIELDSFFNGAYYNVAGNWGLENDGFDNQAIFKGEGNYENNKHNERYDHIAITAGGVVTTHIGEYYMDGTTTSSKLHSGKRDFLNTNRDNASQASTSDDCATRFADVGANNRLFTVWAEYNGTDKKMYVSIANGDFKNAVRPATPQINGLDINLDDYLENGKPVYLGFTSAVASSKANHTIHAFQFINKYEPIKDKAEYKVEYYLQDENDRTKYILQTNDTVTKKDATVDVKVKDTDNNYKKVYDRYDYATVDESVSEITVAADGTSVLKLYYKLKDEVKYKLNYHLKDKITGEYGDDAVSEVKTGYVGEEVFASDVDAEYVSKYSNLHYVLSTKKEQNDSKILADKNITYEMDVYYDPAEATYQLHYFLYNPDIDNYEEKTEDASLVQNGFVGNTYKASDVDGTYAGKYASSHYALSTTKKQEDKVTLAEEGKNYDMKVYYDPEIASYRLNYHKYNSEKREYELTETSQSKEGYVGKEYQITDVDADYGTKYENYTVNASMNDSYKVTLAEAGKTYDMHIYYDPSEAGYKLNYYKLNPDTENYEYIESTPVKTGDIGGEYTITDADSKYESKYTADGYTVNSAKNEDYSVKIEEKDKTYEMKVYYDPPKTTYKTEYYLEQPDGSFEKKDETTSGETYAGKTVDAEEKTYDGYTHVVIDESLEKDVVKPDGSTTLKVYYKYPAPVYKTEYYVEKEDGTYELHSSKDYNGKTGEEVEAEIITIEGYEHTTIPETHEKDTVKADSSTVLKVYYNKVNEPYYEVQYYVEQEDGTYKIYTEKKKVPGTTGEEVEAEIITIDGYEHITIPDSIEKDTVKGDNSTVLKVYYSKIKDPVYKVQYYVQQKDGTYKLYTEKTNLKGKEGEEVEADIIKIPGYVHTTTDDSNEKDVVNGDNSTVLKVYYNLKPEEPTTEEPTTKEPTTEEPTTKEPTTEEPTTKEPTTEEPTTKEPATEEPTTKEPTTEKPTTEEPTMEKPTVKETPTQPPTTKAPVKEVKTGDSTSNSLFVMFLSAMAVAYGCFFGRKKKREE